MHEWALAEGIIATAEEYGKKNNASEILKIVIVLGELQDIEREILEFAMNQLRKGTMLENAAFIFEEERAKFRCRKCCYEWTMSESEDVFSDEIREDIHFVPEVVHSFLSCPQCGSRDFEVSAGRGVYIKEMEVR